MPEYHKLVRGRIPEIITADGMTPFTRILSDDEYEHELIRKIAEEQKELAAADTIESMMEELADIQAAVKALARHISSVARLNEIETQKEEARGGFEQKIFLERTE